MTAVHTGHRNKGHGAVSRIVTLVLAVGFAVVGIAGAASAHHNTITGTVACATNGGWAVTWTVVNSEASRAETITASNRTWAMPVGTPIGAGQTGTYTETVTTKPTSAVELKLTGRWKGSDYDVSQTNSGYIAVSSFEDKCNVKTVEAPSVPVVDECGPGNAHYGTVPSGQWTSVVNPDGSLTITANPGYSFPDGQQSVTLPVPTDSNAPCPVVTPPVVTPPAVTPPVVVPPVVVPPEVLPAEVRVVRAAARSIDKCGRASDLFKVAKRTGVVYTVKGKVVRQGVWIKAKTRSLMIRATAADATYALDGKRTWQIAFTTRPCAQAPQVSPATGS